MSVCYEEKAEMYREAVAIRLTDSTLYRATIVDSRDHQVYKLDDPIIASSEEQARVIAFMSVPDLDVANYAYYDILLEVIGYIRPKRDLD